MFDNFIQFCAAAVCSFLFMYYFYKKKPSKHNLPPGPIGLPLLGVLPFLGKHPGKTFVKWSEKYGPIISCKMGRKLWVVLNDYDSVYQALVQQGTKLNGRPTVPLYKQLTQGYGLILIDDGPLWKTQRKFGLSTFRVLGMGNRNTEDRIIEEASYLNESIRHHYGNPFDILSDLSNAVANILCGVVMGRRFDYDDPKFEEIKSKTQRAFSEPECNSAFILLLMAPELGSVPPFSRYARRLVGHVSACFEMLREIIKEHDLTYDALQIRDFVDAFLCKQKEKSDSTFMDTQLIQYIRDLFVAGIETTTSTLRWGVLCLIHFPHIQEKLRNEIWNTIGNSRQVRMANRDDMPYTCAFIQELYRYRTVVPMNIPHRTTADVELNGYNIPKDTIVVPHLWAVHNDLIRWPEPEKFLPERHLDDDGKFIPSSHIIPFSLGGRHCLGKPMASMEIFIFLVSLVQKFEITKDPTDQELPDINNGVTGLTFVPLNFKMVAKQL